MGSEIDQDFYFKIKEIIKKGRASAYKQISFIMVEAYWNIGKRIVDAEQKGEARAEYGKALIQELSKKLTDEFGKDFKQTNLKMMWQFYLAFPKSHTLCDQLSWSHYRLLVRIKNEHVRLWYMEETAKSNWSVRVLERQINSHYYERLFSSRDKKPVIAEAVENTKGTEYTPENTIKDPCVLEFLDLKDNLFVSKYQLYLPTEEELRTEFERDLSELELGKN